MHLMAVAAVLAMLHYRSYSDRTRPKLITKRRWNDYTHVCLVQIYGP